ncbi:hypothetical protein JCM3775_000523 [Rhodotorula graminis]
MASTSLPPPTPSPRVASSSSSSSSDDFAFLEAKHYLTTIRMPSFASSPFEAGAHAAADLEAKSASSASSSSSSLPWTPARRDSYSSMYSSPSSAGSSTECGDSSDEDEAVTPPVSPDLLPTGAAGVDLKGKGKQADHDAFNLAALHFSLADVAEDDAEWVQAVPIEAVVPTPVAPSPRGNPAAPSSTTLAAKPTAPDPHEQAAAAAVRPVPQPSPPESVAPPPSADDDARGRSRWPRLLWRSELDVDSLVVLRDYHERAIGEPLPVLRRGMRPREVARWSRRMEDAGL